MRDYTFVDFCAGAGGPTPFIEKDLNSQLADQTDSAQTRGPRTRSRQSSKLASKTGVQFVLTDLHPHIPDWTEAAKRSDNLSFVSKSVDAANAPEDLVAEGEAKVFRLYNLAFHHFDNKLGADILRNTLETADGFGYACGIRLAVSHVPLADSWPEYSNFKSALSLPS